MLREPFDCLLPFTEPATGTKPCAVKLVVVLETLQLRIQSRCELPVVS